MPAARERRARVILSERDHPELHAVPTPRPHLTHAGQHELRHRQASDRQGSIRRTSVTFANNFAELESVDPLLTNSPVTDPVGSTENDAICSSSSPRTSYVTEYHASGNRASETSVRHCTLQPADPKHFLLNVFNVTLTSDACKGAAGGAGVVEGVYPDQSNTCGGDDEPAVAGDASAPPPAHPASTPTANIDTAIRLMPPTVAGPLKLQAEDQERHPAVSRPEKHGAAHSCARWHGCVLSQLHHSKQEVQSETTHRGKG